MKFSARLFWPSTLCLLGILAHAQPGLAQQKLKLLPSTDRVGQFEKIEFHIVGLPNYVNPFNPDEIGVNVEFTTPAGQKLKIPAFYAQDYERKLIRQKDWMYPKGLPEWKARFAPMELGTYQAVVTVRGVSASSKPISFDCVPSQNKGFVRISQKDPRFLEFSKGQPFFPIGQNLAFIGNQQYVSLSKAEDIFGQLRTNLANYLRVWTCCEDWAMAIEAKKSAWQRSWDKRAPLVPMPGATDTNLQCLKISGPGATLNVNPSHTVALRPETRYAVSGKARTEAGVELRMEINGKKMDSVTGSDWTGFRQDFKTGPNENWLDRMNFRLEGNGAAWLSELSLQEAEGGPELLWEAALNRPVRGYYNPLDCFMLDELVAAAEKKGVYLQLTLLTRDLYMNALKDPDAREYAQAIADARKLLRYVAGRWGYSTSVAAWEYWNEMNPGLPTGPFYTALGEYLDQIDVYHHLRTTSTWGPSAKDCQHPKLDFADAHFYLRPADKGRLRDEVEAVLERTRWIRQQAPQKPAHLGEFGLANDKWQPTEEMKQSRELADFHNALWASALSGSTGTALFWWWDRLDTRNAYPMYRPLSAFIADVPWNSGEIQPVSANTNGQKLQIIGLKTQQRAWVWLFDPAAAWARVVIEKQTPPEVRNAQLELKSWAPGTYRAQWFDTREGKMIREEKCTVKGDTLTMVAPVFARDIACKIVP